jgi:hypothetical protein
MAMASTPLPKAKEITSSASSRLTPSEIASLRQHKKERARRLQELGDADDAAAAKAKALKSPAPNSTPD